MRDRLPALGAFLVGAFRPLRQVNAWIQELGIGAAGVAVFYAVEQDHGWRWAAVAALGLLALLFMAEGTRLQHEKHEREHPRFDAAEPFVETMAPAVVFPVNFDGVTYRDNLAFWVTVHNHGPTATFLARLTNVAYLPNQGPIPELAWENTFDPTYRIARGGHARIRLANLATNPEPRRFWWWAARSASWAPDSHQVGWRYEIGARDRVEFELEVVNLDADQIIHKYGGMNFAEDPPDFVLVDEPRQK